MFQSPGLPRCQKVLQQFPGTRSDLEGRLVEGIQFRGILTEYFFGCLLGAVECIMFDKGR